MYLLVTALVSLSGTAHADILLGSFGGCGTKPPPCLGIYTGDYTIVPPDWYLAEERALEGQLNYYRIEVIPQSGVFDLQVGGRWLSEAYYSERESEKHDVYYVPASAGAGFIALDLSREEKLAFELLISGSATLGPASR